MLPGCSRWNPTSYILIEIIVLFIVGLNALQAPHQKFIICDTYNIHKIDQMILENV